MTDNRCRRAKRHRSFRRSPAKKPYERPVLTKLGALRDVTLTEWSSKGRRDGRKNRNTGRGGMNGLSRDSAS